MTEKLYLESGYLNMEYIINLPVPFIFVLGGRGTGKTYGALKYLLDNDKRFIMMRRTQTQVDMIKDSAFNPFNALPDHNIIIKSINKNMSGVYKGHYEDGLNKTDGAPIGFLCALSTISNIRGFNAEDVEIILYDEFIGEKHERAIRSESDAVLNAYETINRNRELKGLNALKMVFLANSNDLANPVFMGLKLVGTVEKMRQKGNDLYINKDRGIAIILLGETAISKAKRETALYKLAGDSEFSEMALKNEFANEEKALIGSRNLKDYKPVCFVGELAVYRKGRQYYITDYRKGTAKEYDSSPMELKRFKRDYYFLWLAYLNSNILFESYYLQTLFERYFGIW